MATACCAKAAAGSSLRRVSTAALRTGYSESSSLATSAAACCARAAGSSLPRACNAATRARLGVISRRRWWRVRESRRL